MRASETEHGSRRRTALLAAGFAGCLLLAPASASAATAAVEDGRMLFTAGEDEANAVEMSAVTITGGFRFTISDRGARVLVPGRGCAALSANSLRCDASGFRVLTGGGDDSVVFPGPAGRDPAGRIDTGPGDDTVGTSVAAILVSGGPGDDTLVSRPAADARDGGSVRGGSGRDRLIGRGSAGPTGPGTKPQRLYGATGSDVLIGGEALYGASGNDRLAGGASDDRLRGERGDDRITGGSGRDRFSGGPGADRIDSATGDTGGRSERVLCGSGRDQVTPGATDRLSRACDRVEGELQRMAAVPGTSRGGLRFRLRCKAGARDCSGSIRLRRVGRLRAYGRGGYRIRSGTTETVEVPLGRAAKRALARRGGVRTRVTTGALAYTITLKR